MKKWLKWIFVNFSLKKRRKLSNQEFQVLVDNIRYTYWQFCFNRIGHKEIEGRVYKNEIDGDKNFKLIWDMILVSFLNSYLLGLAKIFDRKSYGDKNTLSIFHFIKKSKFNKDDRATIRKVKQARNEIIAHLEATKVMEGKNRLEHFGLDGQAKDIESLFTNTFNLVNNIEENFSYKHKIDPVKEKAYIQKEFDKWFKIFKEMYT